MTNLIIVLTGINALAAIVAAVAAGWCLYLYISERRKRLMVVWGRGDVPSPSLDKPDWDLVVNFEVANGSSVTEGLLTTGTYVDGQTGEQRPLELYEINDLHPASGERTLLTEPTIFGAIGGHSVRSFRLIYKAPSKFKARSFKVTVSSERGQSFTWRPQEGLGT